jgi:carbon-monoxide dehydrogenase medium subunit
MVIVAPGGERVVPAGEFFVGIMTTALREDEIVAAVEVPIAGRAQGSAYEKFSHPASRYAVLGAAALVTIESGRCSAAQIAVGGLLPCARRAVAVERALVGQPPTADTIAAAANQVASDLGNDVSGDLFASAEYRAAMAPVYVRRAVAAAVARAGQSGIR